MTDQARPAASDLVPFRIARTPFEARVIAAVLESAGIPTVLPDGMLADEFASSQRLMNLQNVRVLVPRARLAEAEEVLKEARRIGAEITPDAEPVSEDGAELESLTPRSTGSERRSYAGLAVLFGIGTMVFGIAWMESRAELADLTSLRRSSGIESDGTTWTMRRPDGSLSSRMVDADHDGVDELVEIFDRAGALMGRQFDADQDGVIERAEKMGRDGATTAIADDADRDDRYDTIRQPNPDGSAIVFLDHDGSGRFATLEVHAADGSVRLRQELDPQRGFVTK